MIPIMEQPNKTTRREYHITMENIDNFIAIAIDGPAGAGKTTQAKILAKELGFVYVDTGALYRAFAIHKLWLEKEAGEQVPIDSALNTFDFEFVRDEAGNQRIMVWNRDVTDFLRTPEVSMEASTTSAHPAVRKTLLSCQRRQAMANNVVMEGRDIGTVVLPDAKVKIYLTADLTVRAQRRVKELAEKGQDVKFCQLVNEMAKRDHQDMTREIAPLKQADGATLVDCSRTNIEETTKILLDVIKRTI